MKLRQFSLQVRLIGLILATVLLFGLAAGILSYRNALHEADELFDAQLAQAARMDVGAVSRQLRVLEDSGYVTKSPSPDNASVVLVTATARGSDVAARIGASRNDHLTRALADWTAPDRRTLTTLLHRLVDDLQATPFTESIPATSGGAR